MNLKEIRINLGLKQHDVAKLLGVTKDYICMIENGRRTPSYKLIVKMAEVYKIPPEEIFLAVNRTICSKASSSHISELKTGTEGRP